MYELNEKVKNLEPYSPISGTYRIRLDANESCFDAPADFRAALAEQLATAAFNRYPDPSAEMCIRDSPFPSDTNYHITKRPLWKGENLYPSA